MSHTVLINRTQTNVPTALLSRSGDWFITCKSHITKFMGPTWCPPGSCRPQMGPMWAPWTLLSGCMRSSCRHQQIYRKYRSGRIKFSSTNFGIVWWDSAGVVHGCLPNSKAHDDVIKWKHFPRHWPFVRGIHGSSVNTPHKDQWHGALMFSLICAWINGWANNREAGDLRRHRAHCDVTVMVTGLHQIVYDIWQ